jgi:hypothetical protein
VTGRRKETELASRLAELGIAADELAAMIDRDPDEVAGWVDGAAEPDADARVLLRIVTDPERSHAAQLGAQRVRDTYVRDMRGDAATLAEIETPGDGAGYQGETGGAPV